MPALWAAVFIISGAHILVASRFTLFYFGETPRAFSFLLARFFMPREEVMIL
jgi:hypothetical protein